MSLLFEGFLFVLYCFGARASNAQEFLLVVLLEMTPALLLGPYKFPELQTGLALCKASIQLTVFIFFSSPLFEFVEVISWYTEFTFFWHVYFYL